MKHAKTWLRARLILPVLALLTALAPAAMAQQPAKPKEPTWLHGLEMLVRKANEDFFTKDTKRWGVEAFKDENTGCLIYITESGALTVLNPAAPLKVTSPNQKPQSPVWLHGLRLAARKAGEENFTATTKRYGIEAFKDDNTGCLIYVSETGSITALNPAGALKVAEKPKEPDWLWALELSARKAGEENFGKDTKRYGLEAFKDTNADVLVYISDVGSVSALSTSPAATKPAKIKEAPFINGLDLQVRQAEKVDFKEAKKYGLEYYKDDNAPQAPLIHITQNGVLSVVVPPVAVKSEPKMKPPKHSHGLELKVRPGGEVDFAKAKKYGLEVFKDENTNCWVYIGENGDIAVVAAK